jgi:hypothetical protein
MYSDFKDLLSVFHAHGVKYLVVGGYAVSFYAQPRATKDIDLFIKADPANAKAVYSALADFGAPLQDIKDRPFTAIPGNLVLADLDQNSKRWPHDRIAAWITDSDFAAMGGQPSTSCRAYPT